jgi:hypothetical protein
MSRELFTLPQHWTVLVGGIHKKNWLTNKHNETLEKSQKTEKIEKPWSELRNAVKSFVRSFGSQIIGITNKTDEEIATFINNWQKQNRNVSDMLENCQKFAYEFIFFLTDGVNFRLPVRLDDAHAVNDFDIFYIFMDVDQYAKWSFFTVVQDGIAMARLATFDHRFVRGAIHAMFLGPSIAVSTVCGLPGFGIWLDLVLFSMQCSAGRWLGFQLCPNLNTGLGVRDGNFELALLGYGFKIGLDGFEINTPIGGFSGLPPALCFYYLWMLA